MTTAVQTKSQIHGILCVVGGLVAISLNDSIIKWVSGSFPLHEVVFLRAIVAILLTVLIARLEGGFALLKTRRLGLQLTRGLLIVVANMCYFLALAAMQLAEAAAIFFIAPLLITALAVPFLGERVGWRRWAAVVVGMAGVVVMLRPADGIVEWAALLPLLAALTYAITQLITRRIGATDRASALAFYIHVSFLATSAAIGLACGDGRFAGSGHPSLEFLFRAWVWPGRTDLYLILACGGLVAIGGYLLSQAYRIAEANVVAPFEYSALPMAVFWGFLLWGDLPDLTAALGIGLIVGGGLYVFYRETVSGHLLAARRPMPRNR